MKQRKAAHRKQGRAAEDLVDAETHLVWVDNVIEAGAGAYLVSVPAHTLAPPSCTLSRLAQNRVTTGT